MSPKLTKKDSDGSSIERAEVPVLARCDGAEDLPDTAAAERDSSENVADSAIADDALFDALSLAYSPEELAPERNCALLESVLGVSLEEPVTFDPFFPAEETESREAKLLAQALDGNGSHALADLAQALRVAHRPESISQFGAERALRTLDANTGRNLSRPMSRTTRLAVVTSSILAAAAALLLVWLPGRHSSPSKHEIENTEIAASRSVAPLFAEAFSQGTSTARIDRIVMARSRDLRHNRYLAWRVR